MIRYRSIFITLYALLLLLLLTCSSEYNPFTDSSNARVVVTRSTFPATDTVELFTAETIEVTVAGKELVDSFRIATQYSRYSNDTVVRSVAAAQTPHYLFRFSYWDTGSNAVIITTYRNNGETNTETRRFYIFSPLAQTPITDSLGNRINLQTSPVSDADVMYHWDFGMGTVVHSIFPATNAIIPLASLQGFGELTVSDLYNAGYTSPPVKFTFVFTDIQAPTVQAITDSMRGDTILAGDTVYLFTLAVADQSGGANLNVTLNGQPFSIFPPPYFRQRFSGLDTLSAPLALRVQARDAYGNIASKTYYLKYDPSLSGSVHPYFIKQIPALDHPVTRIRNYTIQGKLMNSYLLPGGFIRVQVNDSLYQAIHIPAQEIDAAWNAIINLQDGSNSVVLRAYSSNMDSTAGLSFAIWYDPNASDSIAPVILQILVDGAVTTVTGNLNPVISVFAYDEGSGISSITVNDVAMTANQQQAYRWDLSVPVTHYPHADSTNVLFIKATDAAGMIRLDTIEITHNNPPVISSGPKDTTKLWAGQAWVDQIVIVDPDKDDVQVDSSVTPKGLIFSSGSDIFWQTKRSDIGIHELRILYSDFITTLSKSWYVDVMDPIQLIPLRFTTTLDSFPDFLEVGRDSLLFPLQVKPGSGVGVHKFSVIRSDGKPISCDSNGVIQWIPIISDTGFITLYISVQDQDTGHDILTPTIHIVDQNQPCSLAVSCSQAFGDSGMLDLSQSTSPETLLFSVMDPDPVDVEKLTVTIRQFGTTTVTELDSHGLVTVIADPNKSLVDRDSVLVTVTDRVGHTFSLLQVVQYFLPRLLVTVNATAGAGGANITSPVNNFPLLVRLIGANFNFARVKNNGIGIFFTKLDGKTVLPHEIDRWDSAGKQAEIWVKLDTIKALSNTSFYLVRDRRATISTSNPAEVFNSAGYQGVWHLKESAAGWSGQRIYKDASPFLRDGIDSVQATGKNGVIGYGQEFDGNYDFIKLTSNIRPTTAYSISAWVYARTVGQISQFIVCDIGTSNNYGYMVQLWNYDLVAHTGGGYYTTDNCYANGVLQPNQWMYITVTWQTNGSYNFYVNGTRGTYGSFASNVNSISYTGCPGTSISDRYNTLNGYMDEVRVSNTVHTASWIKMCYESQKPLSAVVQVEYRP